MRALEFVEKLPALINKTADVDGIQVSVNADGANVTAYATSDGRRLGYVVFDRDGNVLVPYDLAVEERYRGQGIAAVMYDYVKSLGFTIRASADQTDAGKYFWRKNRGRKRVWESKIPSDIEDFLYDLTPDDVGVEEFGPYRVHFEGFTDDCQSSADYCENPEAVYQQVFADHIAREGGRQPIEQNFTGDEDYPILYSIFKRKKVNENKTLDPDIYGEMLPTATVKRIVTRAVKQVDPNAKVSVKQSPEGYYICRAEGLRLDFGITADGGDINANIVNAYSSYKGAGVVTRIFGECFRAAEQLWGKPNRFVMSAHEDRGHGVWQHIAQKLGAKWEGSINEIARIPQGDFGTAGTIVPPGPEVERKELPGGSGLTYGINRENDLIEIMIFNGDKLAGELDLVYTRGPAKTWEVDSVAVEPAHRGRGIAKALYGIALSILKLPVEAGQMQTKHGQQMWLMLNSIPGVEVVGYNHEPTQQYQARPGDKIIKQYKDRVHYTFPVSAGTQSMRSRRPGTGIYTSPSTTMIARWTGQ